MDADRFDNIVRSLSSGASRRSIARALGGLSLTAILAPLLGLADAEGKKKRGRNRNRNKKCKGGTKKCGKKCIEATSCCSAADCDDGETCQNGACSTACERQCGGKECGADGCGGSCGECSDGESCQNGTCTATCVPDCAGKECGDNGCGGSCGSCDADQECVAGQCRCTTDSCDGCCDGGSCRNGTSNALCGIGGEVCVACSGVNTCGGGGIPGVCGCSPTNPCAAGVCGTVQNNCGQNVNCGACSGTKPICVNHVCTACSQGHPCPVGQCCAGNGSCGACLVFITSSVQQGDLNGLTGADAICQDLADTAGLPGEYLAWLSDSTDSPNTRFVHATAPYKLVNGTTVANSWADLIDGTLAHGIDLTEGGGTPNQSAAWTYTETNGTPGGIAANEHCLNWASDSPGDNGNYGRGIFSDANWTKFGVKDCTNEHALYCFQQR